MATHELPEWEAPTRATTKSSFFKRLSNPFTIYNPFASTARPAGEPKKSIFDIKSPLTRTQNFDKETSAAFSTDETAATTESLSPNAGRRTYFGRSRRTYLIVLAVLILIGLIIGLAVGLHHHSYVDLNTFIYNSPI